MPKLVHTRIQFASTIESRHQFDSEGQRFAFYRLTVRNDLLSAPHDNSQGSRVPTLLPKKLPGLFQDLQNVFTGLCRSPAMFKHTDKQQLLSIYSVSVPSIDLHMVFYT